MAVKKVWSDEENFVASMEGNGITVIYRFPIKELEQGASLARMLNVKARETREASGISRSDMRAITDGALDALRGYVEPYFASRGVGA